MIAVTARGAAMRSQPSHQGSFSLRRAVLSTPTQGLHLTQLQRTLRPTTAVGPPCRAPHCTWKWSSHLHTRGWPGIKSISLPPDVEASSRARDSTAISTNMQPHNCSSHPSRVQVPSTAESPAAPHCSPRQTLTHSPSRQGWERLISPENEDLKGRLDQNTKPPHRSGAPVPCFDYETWIFTKHC